METYQQCAARLAGAVDTIEACRFQSTVEIAKLPFRNAPAWHALLVGRHIGIHRPDARNCNWIARVLTADGRYLQKCLGPALDLGRSAVSYSAAITRAFDWFDTPQIKAVASEPKTTGRRTEVCFCPIGTVFTVGHALRDYAEWSRIARSPGSHYNNICLINFHLGFDILHLPLEEFNARHLTELAQRIIATRPHYGFSRFAPPRQPGDLGHDEIRRRKRTFNALVSILRMAFRHAWEIGSINSERPWRCLRRLPVVHSPRTVFLTREECARLISASPPPLRLLVLAALYTGCRVGELAQMTVEDVGHQVFGVYVRAFKRSPARFVFLPDEGMAFFLRAIEGRGSRELVFTSHRGLPWSRQYLRPFAAACSKASMPRGFVFHGLRHTYASDLIRQGVPLDVIARQLGHADTRTVANTYGHLSETYREEMIRTRFSPLSEIYQVEMVRRRADLDRLWSTQDRADWRSFAAPPAPPRHPRQLHGSPALDVLSVFDGWSH